MRTSEFDLTTAVEATAKAMFERAGGERWPVGALSSGDHWRTQARAAIEAALPHLSAQISEEIAVAILADGWIGFTEDRDPYRRGFQAGRLASANIARTFTTEASV